MREPVFAEVEGRKIFAGWVDGEVFEKEITERSIFRNSKAWGTEREVIEKLESRGVRTIRLIRKDTGEVLRRAFPLRLPGKPEQLLVQLKHFASILRV